MVFYIRARFNCIKASLFLHSKFPKKKRAIKVEPENYSSWEDDSDATSYFFLALHPWKPTSPLHLGK